MIGRFALALLFSAAAAAPCLADDLSFKDLGPWGKDLNLSRFERQEFRHMPFVNTTVPVSGTATYTGKTRGIADLTPSTTDVTSRDRLSGTVLLNVDFGKQTISGGIDNLRAVDPRTGATTNITNLAIVSNPTTPQNFASGSFNGGVGTFSAYYPVGGPLKGEFHGTGAPYATGSWTASGFIPQSPTPSSITDVSIQAHFLAARH